MAAETTPDLTEFIGLNPQRRKKPCQVGTAADSLERHDRMSLEAACATDKDKITTGAIHHWLKLRGHKASVSAITNHRAGSCSCDG